MNINKILYTILSIILLSLPSFSSEKWVSTLNTNPPVVFLDTNSIKRFRNGAVYNVRYINKNNQEILAQIYTDLDESAAILSAENYSKKNKYDTYKIPNDVKMKHLTPDSSIYNSLIEVKKIAKTAKNCSSDKCTYINSSSQIGNSNTNSFSGYRSNASETNLSSGGGNPGVGGGRPGIDAIKEPDFGPYMRELQRRIKMNWDPPKGNESKRVVLLFKIAKDGRLLSCSVYKSSGLQKADEAALEAVKMAEPFRPLPSEFKGESIDIQFTFDYNVFGATQKD